jgi:hypothetical protein
MYRHWRQSSPFRDSMIRIAIAFGFVAVIVVAAWLLGE